MFYTSITLHSFIYKTTLRKHSSISEYFNYNYFISIFYFLLSDVMLEKKGRATYTLILMVVNQLKKKYANNIILYVSKGMFGLAVGSRRTRQG
jgi:hypothetical protein